MQIVGAITGASVAGKSIHGMQFSLPYQIMPNIPMVALHGIISRPLPGADAVLLYHQGDPSNAVCVGVNDARYHLQGLPDGCVGIAHHLGASILFYDDHIDVQGNGKPVVIENASAITIKTTGGTGTVRIEGKLEVTQEVTAMVDGAAVHLSTHEHSGVQGGGGTSAGPVPNT